METPDADSLVVMAMARPISALEARIVALTSTEFPECVRTSTRPKRCSMETLPPRNVSLLLTVSLKSSACIAAAARRAAAATAALLIRSMGFLPQHVVEGLLLLAVNREELSPEVRVLSIALDVGLAFGDGVVEQDELLLVADHQRRRRLLELRLGELFELRDRRDVRLFGGLDVVHRFLAKDRGVEGALLLARAESEAGGDADADHQHDGGGNLQPSRRSRAPFISDGPLDARPQQIAVPCRVQTARGAGEVVPLRERFRAFGTFAGMQRRRLHRNAIPLGQ